MADWGRPKKDQRGRAAAVQKLDSVRPGKRQLARGRRMLRGSELTAPSIIRVHDARLLQLLHHLHQPDYRAKLSSLSSADKQALPRGLKCALP